MYKFFSRALILAVCVAVMTVSLPIDGKMIVCVLLTVILCIGTDFIESKHIYRIDGRIQDITASVLLLAGTLIPQMFILLPYTAMPVWQQKYRVSRICAVVAFGCGMFRCGSLFAVIMTFIMALVGIFLSYAGEKLEFFTEQLHRMRDDSTEHDLLMEQVNRQLIETQDAKIYNATLRERNRIAREIHDNVGHMLTRSILQVGAINVINHDETLATPLGELQDTLNTAMDSMRKSVHDLHDESVDLKNSLEQLESLAAGFSYRVDYDCEHEVPKNVKYAFIAIAREAVNNAVKHSSGDRIDVVLREHPAFYQLQISDNGKQKVKEWTEDLDEGIGIKNMRERVAALGGTIRIDRNAGFNIFVTVMKK